VSYSAPLCCDAREATRYFAFGADGFVSSRRRFFSTDLEGVLRSMGMNDFLV